MVETDDILQGFLIGSFTLIGLSALAYCLRRRDVKYNMKKSASMEEINSMDSADPV
jgi:hypothetical protein